MRTKTYYSQNDIKAQLSIATLQLKQKHQATAALLEEHQDINDCVILNLPRTSIDNLQSSHCNKKDLSRLT